MNAPDEPREEPAPTPQQLGEALAAQLGESEWVLDAEELLQSALPIEDVATEAELPATVAFPVPIPLAQAAVDSEVPPSPLQIIEAMLFIGGSPLSSERACEIIRGLGAEQFHESIEILNRVYRMQNRPYVVLASELGYTLTVRPRYRSIKERIFGGPREARLNQPALDVLSLVAYRQPVAKAEIDSIRGSESGGLLRQLVRLGLISVVQRAESQQREVFYGTTPRFLDLFNLKSLDDLPRIGDPQRL